MATTITMPKLGLTMNSGSVQQWKKKVGDAVKKGELLYVVATDKLTVDVESPADGVLLAITVKEGEDVPVGAPIGLIGAQGEQGLAPAPVMGSANPEGPPARPLGGRGADSEDKSLGDGRRRLMGAGARPCSPKAKKLAREKGVDLSALQGTGPQGWIVARDVLAYGSQTVKASPVAAKMAAEAGIPLESFDIDRRVMKADVQALIAPPRVEGEGTRSLPVTQMRRIIGERMLRSVATIPSVCYFAEVDMTALNGLRAAYNERLREKGSTVKISVNDILMKFCAKLLLENPMVNASVETETELNSAMRAFILHDAVNIGFAVALTGGLLVPNVKNVESKSLTRIAEERAELVEKARNGGLAPDQMTGGTFTISNLGMMNVDAFTPIINPPEAAILGVGTTADKPVVKDGSVVVRPISTFCLSADHRLVDGADAALFLAQLKELVENPDLFLL
ncbi:MAG: 2-oxo acid dehydrogenase subunit E2 [Synergistaceae bacterium]|jgi:pyruvate dehydrogenase E2 component (dihydrolipoamide acetyltransferase)|nr:2-oxo acid dehydrogenase subunit E2 [Synergistaceae bacterium]